MSSDAIIGIYQRHVLAFDAARWRGLSERGWLERFLRLIPAGGRILDLGCGMGEPIARHLIEAGHPVTGVDSSPGLLALCRQRFADQDWHLGDMRGLDLGERFAGVLAWDSFFHLNRDDQRGMFSVFARHAAPGAALMFTSGPAEGEAIGSFEGEPLFHASLGPAEYRALLDGHGFEVEHHIAEDAACGGHTVWLAHRRGSDLPDQAASAG